MFAYSIQRYYIYTLQNRRKKSEKNSAEIYVLKSTEKIDDVYCTYLMGFSYTSLSSFCSLQFPSHRPQGRTNFHGKTTLRFCLVAMPNSLRNPKLRRFLRPNPLFTCNRKLGSLSLRVHASNGSNSPAYSSDTKLIVTASVFTATLAIANRVLYKLALVPMKEYPFFLAQLTTFG